MIDRHEYPQIPPKVEYPLSEKGKSLYPVMEAMCKWGTEHWEEQATSMRKINDGKH